MKFLDRMASATAFGAAMLIGTGLSAPPAEAAFVMTLEQDGPNVVATGSGTIDLVGLSPAGGGSGLAGQIDPSMSAIVAGATGTIANYEFSNGPTNFGTGGTVAASSGSGDLVFVIGSMFIGVPGGYVSDSFLSDQATWDNATFASPGVTPGTYKWTWGSGADADSFTLIAGAAPAAPEPSTWAMMLIGFLGLAGVGLRQKKRTAAPTAPSLGI
jgi:PEP-CTERM motif